MLGEAICTHGSDGRSVQCNAARFFFNIRTDNRPTETSPLLFSAWGPVAVDNLKHKQTIISMHRYERVDSTLSNVVEPAGDGFLNVSFLFVIV